MGSSRCESPTKAPLYHLSLGIRPPLFDGNITITKIKSPCFTSVHGSLFYVYTVYIVVKPHCHIVSSLKPNVSPSSCVHHYSWVKSQCFAMCCQFFMGKPRVNKIYSCSKHGLLPCVHHFPWFKTPSLHVLWLVKAAAVLPATMVFNGKNLLFYQPPSTTINHHWRRHHQPPSTTRHWRRETARDPGSARTGNRSRPAPRWRRPYRWWRRPAAALVAGHVAASTWRIMQILYIYKYVDVSTGCIIYIYICIYTVIYIYYHYCRIL